MMSDHNGNVKKQVQVYIVVFVALLVLTVVTVADEDDAATR